MIKLFYKVASKTLPESFDTFKLNYSMNKLEYTVTELMKELHTAVALSDAFALQTSQGDCRAFRRQSRCYDVALSAYCS